MGSQISQQFLSPQAPIHRAPLAASSEPTKPSKPIQINPLVGIATFLIVFSLVLGVPLMIWFGVARLLATIQPPIPGLRGDSMPKSQPSSPGPQPSKPSAPQSSSSEAEGCVITVTHPFATFADSPSHRARSMDYVQQGKYKVLDSKLVPWVGRDEMWYQINYKNRLGWVNGDPMLIGEKTAACP